jgi:hypothetical protein
VGGRTHHSLTSLSRGFVKDNIDYFKERAPPCGDGAKVIQGVNKLRGSPTGRMAMNRFGACSSFTF